jgi:hypothetical protein
MVYSILASRRKLYTLCVASKATFAADTLQLPKLTIANAEKRRNAIDLLG